ncbi:MAG: divalent metal cation transporter [Candidatus Aminicenantes bacterium]|nr:MAG: divalent metal cation transporter [Candidatus Aminicenantes bacterium]
MKKKKILTKIESRVGWWSKRFGPGLITGAADDDPSGIVTYSNLGAKFRYALLWMAFYIYPLMVTVQEICARVGWVTGRGLSDIIKSRFPKWIYFPLIFAFVGVNIINIGADLLAMSDVSHLFLSIPRDFLMIFFALIIIGLEVFLSYKTYAKFLKFSCLFLLAYPISAVLAHPEWSQVLKSLFLPCFSLKAEYLLGMIAFFGTTISPYLFFWQSNEEIEEEIEKKKIGEFGQKPKRVTKREIRKISLDTRIGMMISELITIFVIVAAGRVLFEAGIKNIETAGQAALVLAPLMGKYASLLFSLGIVGTGLLAVPVLAGASAYALSEAFNQKEGLYLKFREAKTFYLIIVFSILAGVFAHYLKIPSMVLLYWTAIISGFATPFILICLMKISNDKGLMGQYTNSKLSNFFGWLTVILMFLAIGGFLFLG